MIYLLLLTLALFAYFVRNLLIAMGWLKSPLLRLFERYGVGDDSYTVLPELVLSFALLTFAITSVVAEGFFSTPLPAVLLVLLYIFGWGVFRSKQFARRFPALFMALPLWYSELRERTSREERRRIAYRWLSLPRSTRSAYSANDHAFNLWADLVIIGTITHTVEDDETLASAPENVREVYY